MSLIKIRLLHVYFLIVVFGLVFSEDALKDEYEKLSEQLAALNKNEFDALHGDDLSRAEYILKKQQITKQMTGDKITVLKHPDELYTDPQKRDFTKLLELQRRRNVEKVELQSKERADLKAQLSDEIGQDKNLDTNQMKLKLEKVDASLYSLPLKKIKSLEAEDAATVQRLNRLSQVKGQGTFSYQTFKQDLNSFDRDNILATVSEKMSNGELVAKVSKDYDEAFELNNIRPENRPSADKRFGVITQEGILNHMNNYRGITGTKDHEFGNNIRFNEAMTRNVYPSNLHYFRAGMKLTNADSKFISEAVERKLEIIKKYADSLTSKSKSPESKASSDEIQHAKVLGRKSVQPQLNDEVKDLKGLLPPGWQMQVSEKGRVYYLDHSSKSTTWIDPRLKRNALNPLQMGKTVSVAVIDGFKESIEDHYETHGEVVCAIVDNLTNLKVNLASYQFDKADPVSIKDDFINLSTSNSTHGTLVFTPKYDYQVLIMASGNAYQGIKGEFLNIVTVGAIKGNEVEVYSDQPLKNVDRQMRHVVSVRGNPKITGTSFSAPVVTAVAANLKTEFPDLSAPEIAQVILNSATPYYIDSRTGASTPINGVLAMNVFKTLGPTTRYSKEELIKGREKFGMGEVNVEQARKLAQSVLTENAQNKSLPKYDVRGRFKSPFQYTPGVVVQGYNENRMEENALKRQQKLNERVERGRQYHVKPSGSKYSANG